ncbi:MAG: DinB family protein [Acidimicrobiales bacterium]
MADTGAALLATFDYVWRRFTDRLVGLTDEEYFWEPVAGCWSMRPDSNGRWSLDGGGGGGPAPEPVPVATIAWRIAHLAGLGLGGFADRRFGEGSLTPNAVELATTVEALPGFLQANYETWRRGMVGLDHDGWTQPLGPSWGPFAEASTTDLALHVLDEVVHHAAEVGLLRDLYQHRSTFRA